MDVSNVQTNYTSYPINTPNTATPNTRAVNVPVVGGGVSQSTNNLGSIPSLLTEFANTITDLTKTGTTKLHDIELGLLEKAKELLKGDTSDGGSGTIGDLASRTKFMIDELAAVIIQQAANESTASLDEARNQADAAKAELMAQAGALRTEAAEMIAGAVAALVMTVVSSAISFVSASKQIKELNSVKKPDLDNVKLEPEEKFKTLPHKEGELPEHVPLTPKEEVEALAAKKKKLADEYQTDMQRVNGLVGAMNLKGNAFSQLASGLGNFVNSIFQAEAKNTEADGAEHAANAQQLQSYSEESQKIADDMKKLVDQILSILKEIADTKAQMMQSMTRV